MTMKTTEGNGSGTLLKCMILVLAGAALMAAMVAASAMPAFTPPQDRGGDNFGGRPAGIQGHGGSFGGTSLGNGSGEGVTNKELCGVPLNPHLSRQPNSTVC